MRSVAKYVGFTAALAIAIILMPMAQAQGPLGLVAYKDKDLSRTLNGNVRNKGDVALAGAIVYLKNTKTLTVKTYIADDEGGFHFHALSPNVDFEIYAEYNGVRSPTKTLSSFDSRTVVNMELKIDANK